MCMCFLVVGICKLECWYPIMNKIQFFSGIRLFKYPVKYNVRSMQEM